MFIRRAIRYMWAGPASCLGLLAGLAGAWRLSWAVVDGVLELQGPAIAWGLRHLALLPGGAGALTLGHVVLARDAETLAVSRAHEHVHVRQYETWGPFFLPAYVGASAWAALRGRHYYYDNAFEREAYTAEAARFQAGRLAAQTRMAFVQQAVENRPAAPPVRLMSREVEPLPGESGDRSADAE
jgi:hypothetical protein